MIINKPKLSTGVTCSMDKSDDLLSAEEPNDEFYHDNTIEDRMNLDKSERDKKIFWKYWTVFLTIGNETADDIIWHISRKWIWKTNKTNYLSHRKTLFMVMEVITVTKI